MLIGKLPVVLSAALAAVVLCNPAYCESIHDQKLTGSSGSTPGGRYWSCAACHICIAGTKRDQAPLWDSLALPAISQCQMMRSVESVLTIPSLLCLSCHDDVVAAAPPTSEAWFAGQRTLGAPATGFSPGRKIGHHPYRVDYPANTNPYYVPIGADLACDLPLYRLSLTGKARLSLECPTCHDVHSSDSDSYLRVSLQHNELCLCCHRQMPVLSRQVYLPMQKEQKVIEGGNCYSCHDK